jgi:hypothetical protein
MIGVCINKLDVKLCLSWEMGQGKLIGNLETSMEAIYNGAHPGERHLPRDMGQDGRTNVSAPAHTS